MLNTVIDNMETKLLNALYNGIYHYYPVGASNIRYIHQGLNKAQQITEAKIKNITASQQTAWSDFINEMKSLKIAEVIDASYIQFPSLTGSVLLTSSDDERFKFTRNIHFTVSLLVPYFTVFAEDIYLFKAKNIDIQPEHRLLHRISIDQSQSVNEYCITIENVLSSFFPEHSPVDFTILFNYKIDNIVPLIEGGDFCDTCLSIYNALFNGFQKNNHTVLR